MQLVSYGSGVVVVEALKKTTSSDPNDKTRRRSAGALTNLACDQTAEKMASHQGLKPEALAQASVSDSSREVQQRTALALTKLANSVVVRMPCWGSLKCPCRGIEVHRIGWNNICHVSGESSFGRKQSQHGESSWAS